MPKSLFRNILSSTIPAVLLFSPMAWTEPEVLGPRPIPTPIYGITLTKTEPFKDILNSIRKIPRFPTTRIYFDRRIPIAAYKSTIQSLRPYTFLMAQIADSADMSKYTVPTYKRRAEEMASLLKDQIDIFEVGNEINGGWLGPDAALKMLYAYSAVKSERGRTALTVFYMGDPNSAANCIDKPGNDIFTWLTNNFQLNLPPQKRDQRFEKMRLGLDYVLVSWYPDGCPILNPNWTLIFGKLAQIFPNSKVGFGELGTTYPKMGSYLETKLIEDHYSMTKTSSLPASFIGGNFWWYFVDEMVPSDKPLMTTLIEAVQKGPMPKLEPKK